MLSKVSHSYLNFGHVFLKEGTFSIKLTLIMSLLNIHNLNLQNKVSTFSVIHGTVLNIVYSICNRMLDKKKQRLQIHSDSNEVLPLNRVQSKLHLMRAKYPVSKDKHPNTNNVHLGKLYRRNEYVQICWLSAFSKLLSALTKLVFSPENQGWGISVKNIFWGMLCKIV